jgi:hypothetical protein
MRERNTAQAVPTQKRKENGEELLRSSYEPSAKTGQDAKPGREKTVEVVATSGGGCRQCVEGVREWNAAQAVSTQKRKGNGGPPKKSCSQDAKPG